MMCTNCPEPAVYVAWMEWCTICNGHPVCVACGAELRSDPGLARLHTLETA